MERTVEQVELEFRMHLFPLSEEFLVAGITKFSRAFTETDLGGIVTMKFANEKGSRELHVSMNASGIIASAITDNKYGYVPLSKYLLHHKRPLEERSLFRLGKDIPRYITYLRTLIRNDLTPILRGETWENIDVDWRR